MHTSLKDKIALVTGASKGVGKGIALELAKAGCDVAVNYRGDEAGAAATVDEITRLGRRAIAVGGDVSQRAQVEKMFQQVLEAFGRLDILVNNAGIAKDNLLALMKPSEWDDVMNTNLKGAFLCSQAVIKPMMRQRYGRIVNVTSVVGVIGNAGQCNYSAAKAGIIGFTRSLAREIISRHITVNAVAPGFIETDMTLAIPQKSREALLSQIPAARYGAPEEVAAAVSFLASDAAGYITGQVIHVNGGMFMG